MRSPISVKIVASLAFAAAVSSCGPAEKVDGCAERCSAHHARCQLDPGICPAQCEYLSSIELECMESDGCSAEAQALCIGSEGECSYPVSQQVSEPCCLQRGVDACGAGLVCAAIESRVQATCYPERSRADMTECSTGQLCASGSCNPASNKCRSALGAACDFSIGCAEDPSGAMVSCQPRPALGLSVCMRSNLQTGAYCNFNEECASQACWCERGGRFTCCS